ncbi:GNAT family N-acetyltransferase [Rhizobium sp. RM]|uniref:GNAT family N-acetyltransferase n=1 Tax=Rhizobium sp. RM TaxID=2748079 RepID=UPI00110D80B1|nr:GNAT family N-acetyltransferase [Rhizobium sp. RM]NWJ25969.1 GNAT family N-acetyltransferase [Rhizobium sp. RM]TMV20582.1 GNAT family N-acetyltransferase [Rhizobium sp. Td3]
MAVILSTDRLYLREIDDSDLVSLADIYADDECMKFYPGTKTVAETKAWFQKLAFESYRADGFGLWAVVDRLTGQVIGDCGITRQQTPAGMEPEIGYHLWREFWGKGLATEAATACRDYALETLGLNRVVSITTPENIASQRVAQRVHDRKEIYQKRSGDSGILVDRFLYISDKR